MRFHKITSITAAVLIVVTAVLCGCGDKNKQPDTQATELTQPQNQPQGFDISSLHTIKSDSEDAVAGMWKIVSGSGSQYKSFVYQFDGEGEASILIGNVGYTGKYTLEKKEDELVFSSQLMYGINGTYTAELSDDGKTLSLIAEDESQSLQMQAVEEFTVVPEPKDNPKVDKAILGAWKSEAGDCYYFYENGIMYMNQFGMMYVFANYEADGSKLSSTYIMSDSETVDEYTYSVKDEVLTLDGLQYNKVHTDQLI